MKHRIVVLGAGYAGAIAAGRLAKRLRREDVAITLVNAEPDFVERVRMHQLATGQDLTPRPFSEMFAGTGVELRLAQVTAVDVDRRTVAVTDAGRRRGTGVRHPRLRPRQRLERPRRPRRRRARPRDRRPPRSAAAARAPGRPRRRTRPWSSSAAASPAWRPRPRSPRPARTSTSPSPPAAGSATGSRPRAARHLRKVFDRLGITVHEHAAVTGVEADRVTTADGTSIPAAVTVWTTGFAVHPIARPPPWRSPTPARSWSTRPCARSRTRTCTPSATRPWRWAPATSRCGCRAPRASPWPGRPPTPSRPA